MQDKIILDPCCGGRMMWFNKQHPSVLYLDKRTIPTGTITQQPNWSCSPDQVCDFTNLPFDNDTFWHIVFEPPHVINLSEKSIIGTKYGSLNKDTWKQDISKGFSELWRVLKPNGTLIFKWSEINVSIKEVLDILPEKPLYGHTTAKSGKTKWFAFVKIQKENE